MEFSWRRALTKEYNTTFGWLTLALCFQMWENYRLHGAGALPAIEWMSYLLLLLLLCYVLVRHLKKTGRRPSHSL